jgi:septum formation protein
MKLVLASTSPRRKQLLGSLKIPFKIVPPPFEEEWTDRSPNEEVLHFAEEKAKSVIAQCPDSLILASDTIIDFKGEKIGKPKDEVEAQNILQKFSGKTCKVLTGMVLYNTSNQSLQKHLEEGFIFLKTFSKSQIQDYIATGEPLDKAGALSYQGLGKNLIEKFEGDLDSIIGLPLYKVKEWLSSTSL